LEERELIKNEYIKLINKAKNNFDKHEYKKAENQSAEAHKLIGINDEAIVIYGRSVLSRICTEFKNHEFNILVIGDIMLDRVFRGSLASDFAVGRHKTVTNNIYMLKNKDSETNTLGGVGYLSYAFLPIVENVTMVGVVGNDCEGHILEEICDGRRGFDGKKLKNENDIKKKIKFFSVTNDKIITTTKIYFFNENINERGDKAIRFDREDIEAMREEQTSINEAIIKALNLILKGNKLQENDDIKKSVTSCIVIDDYEKGMISNEIIKYISDLAVENKIKIYIDPKYKWDKFKKCDVEAIIPNRKECKEGLKTEFPGLTSLNQYPHVNKFVIKMDSDGAYFFDEKKSSHYVKPYGNNDDASDVGCGTIFDAYFITSMLCNNSVSESVFLANYAAGLMTMKQLGQIITPEDVIISVAHEVDYFIKNRDLIEISLIK
jgi:bifunctional ADP-heptose synthase (sugar kinase/adenylyltransferase)